MASAVIDLFLSRRNVDHLRVGVSKEHFAKLLPEFVSYMRQDIRKTMTAATTQQQVIKYNNKFKQLLYERTMNDYDTESMASQYVGQLSSGDYTKSADAVLDSWNMNVARQTQQREDRQQYVADLDEPDYDLIGPQRKSDKLTDIYSDGTPEAFTDPSEVVFGSKQMKQMNATGYGYSMTHDDHDSALALQEQIFGSSDLGAENGYLGVRADVNYKERKNHKREYDRGNDGIRGTELEGMPLRQNMKNLRKRY
jgi:hypothetical protein